MTSKVALDILNNANWTAVRRRAHVFIEATYKGREVSIRDDSTELRVKENGKIVKLYDVGGTEEFESLFGLFWRA